MIFFTLSHIHVSKGRLIQGDDVDKTYFDQYRHLGLNIAYYRKFMGMSQSLLAEKVDISRTHMSRIETADCAVSLDIVFKICDVLEISPKKLFDFRD